MDSRHPLLTMFAHEGDGVVLAALRRWTAGSPRTICAYEARGAVLTSLLQARGIHWMHKVMKGTTTWEVHDVCYADSCTHGKRFVLGGRSCMRMLAWSMSADVSLKIHTLTLLVADFISLNPIPRSSTLLLSHHRILCKAYLKSSDCFFF